MEDNTLGSKDEPFIAKAIGINSILNGIHNHGWALPVFQRPWSWGADNVRDLIISIAYCYPAGSLLTMSVTSSKFALKPFEGSGKELKDKPNLMVLDGQQRLTSLYQAIYSHEGVTFGEEPNLKHYFFYLDIPYLMSDPDGCIEVGNPYFEGALFYILLDKKNRKIRYDGLKKVYELKNSEEELGFGALPLNLISSPHQLSKWREKYFEKLAYRNSVQPTWDDHKKLSGIWDRLVQPWINNITEYQFPEIRLRSDLPLSAICHIFEKVNSKGMPLNVFDLCNAILWAQGLELNKKWETSKKQLKDTIPMQPITGTAFLQSISLLDSVDKERANPEERIAISCRKKDLMQLNAETVTKWWDILLEAYKDASDFMSEEGILNNRILPYTTMIVPLTAIFADIKKRGKDRFHGVSWPKIKQWYWCSVFSQRYSGPLETNSATDFEQVINWIDGGPIPDAVRTFTFRSDILQEITSIHNAVYKGILCLLARNGAMDFAGGAKLDIHLYHENNIDHHHIFPTKSPIQLGLNDKRVDTIVNKTLISARVNRCIKNKNPKEYTKILIKELGTEKCYETLRSHAINPDYLSNDQWKEFFIERREKLRQLIESACGGVFQPFSDSLEDLQIMNLEDYQEETP